MNKDETSERTMTAQSVPENIRATEDRPYLVGQVENLWNTKDRLEHENAALCLVIYERDREIDKLKDIIVRMAEKQ